MGRLWNKGGNKFDLFIKWDSINLIIHNGTRPKGSYIGVALLPPPPDGFLFPYGQRIESQFPLMTGITLPNDIN